MTTNTPSNAISLRTQISKIVRKVLKSEELQSKEMQCFDELLSRRQFISGSAKFAGLGALISSGLMPSAWGKLNSDYASDPTQFGITSAEMAEETNAYQLTWGTELYTQVVQDKVYESNQSKQGQHVALESFNYGQLKIQSMVEDSNPTESSFIDTGANYGSIEMAQLSQDHEGNWGIEVLERNRELDDKNNVGGNYVSSRIPSSEFTGLAGDAKLFPLHHPMHNTLDPTTGNMRGVQAFLIFSRSLNDSFLCIRWMEASTELQSPQSHISPWEVKRLSSLLPAVDPVYHIDTYTDVTMKSYVIANISTGGSNTFKRNIIFSIEGWKEVACYDIVTKVKDGVSVGNPNNNTSNIIHITQSDDSRNMQETFNINVRGLPAYTSIRYSPEHITDTRNVASNNTTFLIQNRRRTDATCEDPIVDSSSNRKYMSWENDYGFRDIYALHNCKVTDINGNTTQATIKIALVSQTTPQGKSKSFIMLLAHDDDRGRLIGFRPFVTSGASFLGDPIMLTGGFSKFGGFTFFSKDANNNILMYRQATEQDPNTPYTPARVDNFLTPPESIESSKFFFDSCPAFANTLLVDGYQQYSGFFIGNKANCIYCPPRFNQRCDMLAIETDNRAGKQVDRSYITYKKQVEKTWTKEPVTQSISAREAEESDTVYQECYRTTITPQNSYGYNTQGNENQFIELRSPEPTTIIVNNKKSYNIDRTKGAMVPLKDTSGSISVIVKAESIACRLMARVIDISTLLPGLDSALLQDTSGEGVTSRWFNINLAKEANKRMTDSNYNNSSALKEKAQQTGVEITDEIDSDDDAYDLLSDLYSDAGEAMGVLNTAHDEEQDLRSGYSTNPRGSDPLFTLHVASNQYQNQVSSNGALTMSFVHGRLVRSQGDSTVNASFNGFFDSFVDWVTDAAHAVANWVVGAGETIKNGFEVAINKAKGTVNVVLSQDFLELLGQQIDKAVSVVVSTCEQFADIIMTVTELIVRVVMCLIRAIVLLIMMLVHIKDIISTIKSAERLHDEMFSIVAEQKQSTLNYIGDFKNNVHSAINSVNFPEYQETQQGVGTSVLNTYSQVMSIIQDGLNAILNSPIVKDVIMPAIEWLSEAVTAALGEVWDTISPILFREMDINLDSIIDKIVNSTTDVLDPNSVENFAAWLLDAAIETAQNPALLNDKVYEILDKANKEFKGTIDWSFELVESTLSLVFDIFEETWTQGLITIQIPFFTKFMKLFGVDLSTSISLKQLNSILLGVFSWSYMYIVEGKSITHLPSIKNNYLQSPKSSGIDDWDIFGIVFDFYGVFIGQVRGGFWYINQKIKAFEKENPQDDALIRFQPPMSELSKFMEVVEGFYVIIKFGKMVAKTAGKGGEPLDIATSVIFNVLYTTFKIPSFIHLLTKGKDEYTFEKHFNKLKKVLKILELSRHNMEQVIKTVNFAENKFDKASDVERYKFIAGALDAQGKTLKYAIDISNWSSSVTASEILLKAQMGFYASEVLALNNLLAVSISAGVKVNS